MKLIRGDLTWPASLTRAVEGVDTILHLGARAAFEAYPRLGRGVGLPLPVTPRLLWDELGLKPTYATIETGIPAVLDEAVVFRWRHPLQDKGGS